MEGGGGGGTLSVWDGPVWALGFGLLATQVSPASLWWKVRRTDALLLDGGAVASCFCHQSAGVMMVSTSSSVLTLLTFLFSVGDQRTDGLDSQLLVLEIVRYFQETVWEVSLANLDIEIYAGMWQDIQGGGFL